MGELAESVLLTRSGVTQLLDWMITAGLVVRKHVRATVSAIAPE
jgi:DNA-binding MarR family transcriptional regulator